MDNLLLLSLGSNLGDRFFSLSFARQRLAEEIGPLISASIIRETAGFGVIDHSPYLNQVISLQTGLPAGDIHLITRAIEAEAGREGKGLLLPRTLDIDILCLGDLIHHEPDLIIPHQSMHLRPFVLQPLGEILPDWKHPVFKKSAAELLSALIPA